jgi:NAD(P)-dependent dehydrogenase (short-subunit alcohol dehydrogenase family)
VEVITAESFMIMPAAEALHGAHIVIIGGGSGIGRATALAVRKHGASVTLVGRSLEKLETVAREIGGANVRVADIVDRKAVEAVFADLSVVDHLVITAGSLGGGKLAESDPDDLLAAISERISGPLYAIKAVMAAMPSTGSIVLTGGQFSDRPSGDGVAVVAAAVRGVEALARSLALELKPIRVNVIAPGFVETPLFDALGAETRSAVLAGAAAALPRGRIGQPSEVAEAITFLLTNTYMNGEVLHIDGGGRLV